MPLPNSIKNIFNLIKTFPYGFYTKRNIFIYGVGVAPGAPTGSPGGLGGPPGALRVAEIHRNPMRPFLFKRDDFWDQGNQNSDKSYLCEDSHTKVVRELVCLQGLVRCGLVMGFFLA